MASQIIYYDILLIQCGNYIIFPSLRFYVKSILQNLDARKLPFFAILKSLNFVQLMDFSLQKVQKFIKIKIQRL